MTTKSTNAADRLERAQMAGAEAASEALDEGCDLPEALVQALRDWKRATEALLSLQTAGRDLVEWEVAYEVIYTGKRRVTAETPMQAEVAVKKLVEDDPTEVDSFPPTVRYSTACRVDGKGKKS